MVTINPSATNQQTVEQFAQAIFAARNPQQSATAAIHAMLDHPWMDDELRVELIQAAAQSLNLTLASG